MTVIITIHHHPHHPHHYPPVIITMHPSSSSICQSININHVFISCFQFNTPEDLGFASVIARICCLLHFSGNSVLTRTLSFTNLFLLNLVCFSPVVEQVDHGASLYSTSIQSHHICLLVKEIDVSYSVSPYLCLRSFLSCSCLSTMFLYCSIFVLLRVCSWLLFSSNRVCSVVAKTYLRLLQYCTFKTSFYYLRVLELNP